MAPGSLIITKSYQQFLSNDPPPPFFPPKKVWQQSLIFKFYSLTNINKIVKARLRLSSTNFRPHNFEMSCQLFAAKVQVRFSAAELYLEKNDSFSIFSSFSLSCLLLWCLWICKHSLLWLQKKKYLIGYLRLLLSQEVSLSRSQYSSAKFVRSNLDM